MKKCLVILASLACLLSVTALMVGAQGADVADWLADATVASVPAFFTTLSSTLFSFFAVFRGFIVQLGSFASVLSAALAALLLLFSLFGYRMYKLEALLLGALTGILCGYTGWQLLLAWVNAPQFLLANADVIRIVVLVLSPLVGILLAFFLRRVGVSLAVAVLLTSCFIPYITSFAFLLVLFAVFFLAALVANKAVVIILTSFLCPVVALQLLFGEAGIYPLTLSSLVVPAVHPLVLIGLMVGVFCAMIQFRVCRNCRYY